MDEDLQVEDELQIAISETFGVLFQTHKDQCKTLVDTLFSQLLPDYLGDNKPFVKKKFALFVIVDLIEHLGLERIALQFEDCFKTLLHYSQNLNPVLRQACLYGFGIIAIHGGDAFASFVGPVIESLKFGIEIQLGTQDQTLFWHARDNAVSSLGKVLKYQAKFVANFEEAFAYWLQNLPIEHDTEEAKIMNEFLIDTLNRDYKLVFGQSNQRVGQVIKVITFIPPEDVMTKKTVKKFKDFFAQI